MPKRIRDPLHGTIPVDAPVLALLDTPEVQRLRHVRQLGTANLVYPGANHTRFEHALGACHLGALAAEALGLGAEEALHLRLALLLHDVGHGPFSHLSEPAMRAWLGVGHKELGMRLVQGPLRGALEAQGVDAALVAGLIDGQGELGALVSGDLDLDRMDYLVRDAHYTGVRLGVDLDRLLEGLARHHPPRALRRDARHQGTVVLREDALQAAELLLVARFMMYSTVYYHHAARVAERMMLRALELVLESGERGAEDLFRRDDAGLLGALRASHTPARDLAARLDHRALLKVALALTAQEAGGAREALAEPKARAALEHELAAEAGVEAHLVIVDLPDLPVVQETRAPVLGSDGALRSLSERSALVASLHRAQLDHWRLRVMGPPGAREALGRAARTRLAEA